MTLTNQKRFEQDNYDHEEMIIPVSHLKWNPITSNQRKELVNEIRVQEIQAQDNQFIHAYELTENVFDAFNIVMQGERPYEYSDDVHFAVNFEMNRNLFKFDREVYTALDWFGNLGGLYEGLKLFFGLIVAACNFNFYKNYMVSNLFMYDNKAGQDPKNRKRIQKL